MYPVVIDQNESPDHMQENKQSQQDRPTVKQRSTAPKKISPKFILGKLHYNYMNKN